MDNNAVQAPAAENKTLWWKPVLFAFAILALGFLMIGILHARQQAVLRGRPEVFLEAYLAETDAASLIEAASEHLDFTVTEFEDPAAIFEAYRALLPKAGELRYERETAEGDEAVFGIWADGVRICRVALRPGPRSFGFGQHDWELDRVSSGELSPQLEQASLTLLVLAGERVFLNGKAVGSDYLRDENLSLRDLSEVERRMTAPPHLEEYRISPLYGEIRLTDETGRELRARTIADGFMAECLPEERYELAITAPESVTVTVNGRALQPEDAESSGLGILADFRDYGEPETLYFYRFTGLYQKPSVSAADTEGRELTPIMAAPGHYEFFPDAEEAALHEEAESFLRLYLDYVAMSGGGQYTRLLRRLAPDTALYRYVAESAQAMVWAPMTKLELTRCEAGSLRLLGTDCFACTVQAEGSGTSRYWDGEHPLSLEKTYELVFVRRDETWLCAAMGELG